MINYDSQYMITRYYYYTDNTTHRYTGKYQRLRLVIYIRTLLRVRVVIVRLGSVCMMCSAGPSLVLLDARC